MPVNHNELTKEMIMQALKCKNADELIALAKTGGIELTKEEAESWNWQTLNWMKTRCSKWPAASRPATWLTAAPSNAAL